MAYHESCPHCGHMTTAFVHKMNKNLANALMQLYNFYKTASVGLCNISKDLHLSHNQINNFQKLKYWKLVGLTPHGYFITHIGVEFCKRERQIDNRILTFANKPLHISDPLWNNFQVKPKLVWFDEVDPETWMKRIDYQIQKSTQTTLV